ncbi:MAG TPA: hypothetical protein VET23_11325, partial [Chitinophagaceae bacterium]|nr:hypothetical protein [Chitinophagaceae bacterium]
VQATIDRNKILIGERIQLTLEAGTSLNSPIHFFSLDSIPHFQFVSRQKTDTLKTSDSLFLKQVFYITSFDSGHWTIPAFFLTKKIQTNPIPVDVVFSDFDTSQNYHDIKDIIQVNPAKENKRWWYYAAAAVILIGGFIIIWVTKRKKKPQVMPVQPDDPYKEAMQQLDRIRKEYSTAKQYYSSLIDTFRMYILRKKGIQSLQKTTDDMVLQLKKLNLDKNQFEQLLQALRLGDFVKFAKYSPASEDDTFVFETIKKSIQVIEEKNNDKQLVEKY